MFNDFTANMSADELAEITDVCFCGGWNDAREIEAGRQTASTLAAKIKTTHATAIAKCPNAMVHAVFMGWQSGDSGQPQAKWASLVLALSCYTSVYNGLNAPFTNVQYVIRDIVNYDDSFFHPNVSGGVHLAEAIKSYIFGGDYNYHAVHDFTAVSAPFDGGVITGFTGGRMTASIINGISKLNGMNVIVNGNPIGSVLFKFKSTNNPFITPLKPDATDDSIYFPILFRGTINGDTVNEYIPLYGVMSTRNGNVAAYYKGAAITAIDGVIAFDISFDNTNVN